MTRAIATHPSDTDNDDVNLTPMLDVVFILLIFFVVTATFIKETGIDVNPPEGSSIEPVSAGILVAISENNEIWIDRRMIDRRALRSYIARLRAENPKGGLVIQADGKSSNETFVYVMNAAREAGVYDIAIAANEPG